MTSIRMLSGGVSVLALVASMASGPALAQSCVADSDGRLIGGCATPDAGGFNRAPVLPNTEPETGPVSNASGFVLSLDGAPIDADPQVEDRVRRTDIALAQTDVSVQLDTIDPTPRLDVEVAGAPRGYGPGDRVTLISESNYPAFITRGEIRIIDRAASGGPRLISVVPVAINGQADVVLPEGRDIVAVHRVYDARGRFDETEALPLSRPDDRGQVDDVEEGTQFTARRGIRVNGGAVTVSASNVPQGAALQTLGETVRPDPSGRVVIQRILPKGDHVVDVAVTGAGQNIGLARPIEVPGSEWFYVGVADLTFGNFTDNQTGEKDSSTVARLQYFVEGELDNGVRIVSSLDTGEQELDELFGRIDEKDPRAIIDRIDPNEGYLTYGDDSEIVDLTPTRGRFFLRVERDNSFLVVGDYQARLDGNGFLRNERSLYGVQGHYETEQTTARGVPVFELDAYAAQPDQVVGRDVFLGTGGSVYFLRQQDIYPGTQTITVEIRDAVTNRVVDRRTLIEGRDYQINHVQGIVTLNQPLTDSLDRRLISTTQSGDEIINLVVQYEFTPTGADVDGLSYGARAEGWVTDDLRLGVTGLQDETGVETQRSVGVDLRYELGKNSFVQLDYAESDGPGFDVLSSNDGGLVFDTLGNTTGTSSGRGIKIEGQADLADLGIERTGVIGGYFEDREEGFSTLDYSVTAATGDERLYGLFAIVEKEVGRLGYSFYADVYENGVGDDRTELGAEVAGDISPRLGYDLGIENLRENDGNRTDVAARLTYALRKDLDVYAFGQGTIASDGLEDNNRYGVGLNGRITNGWDLGAEISGGTGGLGTRLLATRTREDNSSVYFGYELDPGRAIDARIAPDDNGGRYVVGGTRHINDEVTTFSENTYDILGSADDLLSTYGVTYTPSTFLTYSATVDFGQRKDDLNGDVERRAFTLGLRYEDEAFQAAARIELRYDDFEDAAEQDTDALFFVTNANYKLSEEARLVFSADIADVEANGVSFNEGSLVDVSLGYAYRPIDNERLNVLFSYRFFFDDVGQEVDGVSGFGPVQESHVLSIEGNYDLNPQWTLGAKFGARLSESATTAGGTLTNNDAFLGVINMRYHAVHKWDFLLEARQLALPDAGSARTGFLGAAYRQVGQHTQIGVGYNFGNFSSDLTDLTFDDRGVFLNLVASF
ncbi:MAG: hypothetical protein WBG95_17480 [Sulfitobacter sp.]